MKINFTNRHIYFAVEGIWAHLDYRFKFHLNEIITANPADDFIQEVEISEDVLMQIYAACANQLQGVAKSINKEMQDALLPQLMAQSNIAAVKQGLAAPNEASRVLIACQAFDDQTAVTKEAKILSGKTQILA